MDLLPDRWINVRLLEQPMSWAIVGVIASIWLLLFHTLMTAFQAMGAPAQGAFAPGLIGTTGANTSAFSTMGTFYPGADNSDVSSNYYGAGMSWWTDGSEPRFAEDGWAGNG